MEYVFYRFRKLIVKQKCFYQYKTPLIPITIIYRPHSGLYNLFDSFYMNKKSRVQYFPQPRTLYRNILDARLSRP